MQCSESIARRAVTSAPSFIINGPPLRNSASPLRNLRTSRRPCHVCTAKTTPASSCNGTEIPPSTLYQLRHSRTFIRSCWRNAIEATGIPTVIDATAGRGSDSIMLGNFVGKSGIVHSLDIQPAALEETQSRYEEARNKNGAMGELKLHCKSHESFAFLNLPERSVACIVYNLGWYPGQGADRNVITLASSTVASLRCAEELVAVDGVVSVTAYVGHQGGKEEEWAVLEWARGLSSKCWNVTSIVYPNRQLAPSMLICERIR